MILTLQQFNLVNMAVAKCVIWFVEGITKWFRQLQSEGGKYQVNWGDLRSDETFEQ